MAMVSELKAYKATLTDYYAVGTEKANAYVKHGPDEGNNMMEKLDPFAGRQADKLDGWIGASQRYD